MLAWKLKCKVAFILSKNYSEAGGGILFLSLYMWISIS